MTLQALHAHALERACSAFEANQLFSFATGSSAHDDLSAQAIPQMQTKLERALCLREQGHPLQYILGEWEFYGLPFRLGPGVLIPRQDTETLVDLALTLLRESENPNPEVLDLGSGSGCIAIAVAKNAPHAQLTALEASSPAYHYLQTNIALNKVQVTPVLGDLREYRHSKPADLIISNPPYISRPELAGLQAEVAHEPLLALDGGQDGLDFYRAIARRYKDQLAPSGQLLLEVGAGQHTQVEGILASFGFVSIAHHKDLTGTVRVVQAGV